MSGRNNSSIAQVIEIEQKIIVKLKTFNLKKKYMYMNMIVLETTQSADKT